MKASELLVQIQAAIDRHGDHDLRVEYPDDPKIPELVMRSIVEHGQAIWYAHIATLDEL